ncbi:DUF5683 domain-containing protein [Chryseolinea sp. H1M3-3]|uniref:DUF5683 domain-containing protein n=1 Tax=Chryseolinea sp. H1M3-3 TaxID=3034144 RepID=UPI0023EA7D46|nr:DUF5683 domain-containing protein [Chryseolinea sp. H1M3-3]
MKKQFAIVIFLLLVSARIMAQDSLTVINDDSLITGGPDTVLLKSYASRYDPRKALLYAAVVPGMGQVYNKKYWKLPLVYGGFFGIGYAINFYQNLYKDYRVQLFYNLNNGLEDDADFNPDDPNKYTTATLRTAVDKARRERDFWVIMMGAMYLLQIVDAHVDAHLKEFDVNPNLKVSIQPSVSRDELLGQQNSLSLVFRF